MRVLTLLLVSLAAACFLAPSSPAATLNLATVTCNKYENEIVGSPDAAQSPSGAAPKGPVLAPAAPARPDAINTVMWLFGFSVAKTGDHFMYSDALTSFGFALDAECKNAPSTSLLQAVASVRPNRDKPMDLAALNCETFESRHAESAKSDPESARTIMMWLFGFSVGLSGNHILDTDGVERFADALKTQCTRNPNDSLFDVLSSVGRPAKR
ncbi:MAG TPA: HdeA/HdeB family chaperone [Steroidobacteraceae bacterium]|nr:HdeA/HdeB family chaperone [Steroidobacteraceae bacterium]